MRPPDAAPPPGAGPEHHAPARQVPALRLDGAELAVLLSLRDTTAATLSRQGLGLTLPAGPEGRDRLTARGLWRRRHGMELPAGQAITVGDTLTCAGCWLRIGTDHATAATIVIGPEHTLLLAALGQGAQEIAALQAQADVAQVAADICTHLAGLPELHAGLHVHVVRLDATGTVHEQIVPADANGLPDLTERLRPHLPQAVWR